LINIAGSKDITLVEISNIIKTIKEKCDPDVHIIHGLRIDPELDGNVQITVIATGFSKAGYMEKKAEDTVKTSDPDIIEYNEYVRMFERTKRPDYLPPKEYQDDLDVPSVIRKNYNFRTEGKQLELTEK